MRVRSLGWFLEWGINTCCWSWGCYYRYKSGIKQRFKVHHIFGYYSKPITYWMINISLQAPFFAPHTRVEMNGLIYDVGSSTLSSHLLPITCVTSTDWLLFHFLILLRGRSMLWCSSFKIKLHPCLWKCLKEVHRRVPTSKLDLYINVFTGEQ